MFAYHIDQGRFAGIPETHLVEVSHWIFTNPDGVVTERSIKKKVGSLQAFVIGGKTAEDMPCSRFQASDVQRIAVLDLLLANCDRNAGNFLTKEVDNTIRLIPIDHAFCLPDYFHLNDILWFEWMTWRQCKQSPVLPEIITFVDDFDMEAACSRARDLHFREECIVTLQLCHIFVREALHKGWTLNQIARLMCADVQRPTILAKLVSKAYNSTLHPGADLLNHFALETALYFVRSPPLT